MKKTLLILLSMFVFQTAHAVCTQNDLNGQWWVVVGGSSGAIRCIEHFNGAEVDTNKSKCVYLQEGATSEIPFAAVPAKWEVFSDCKVKMVTLRDGSLAHSGYGWMSRSGETIVGASQSVIDGSVLRIHAVKMQ